MDNNQDHQEPMTRNKHDEDFVTLRLGPRNSPPPPEQPYRTAMHGLRLSPPVSSFHPYMVSPNPNPNFRAMQHPNGSFVPNFGSLQDLLNGTVISSLRPTPAPQNPNPSKLVSSYGPVRTSRPSGARKRRSSASRGLHPGKSKTVPVLFPWATERRATVHSLEHLSSEGIDTIAGEVQCKRCEKKYEVGYDLKSEFSKIRDFIVENKEALKDRSAEKWDSPACIDCQHCKQKECVKAVVADKKRQINWLFLLLGGFLCCCTLEQLKYFCKHTGNHRTGAKNRVLYLTYLGLCKQLDPSGPFDPLAR